MGGVDNGQLEEWLRESGGVGGVDRNQMEQWQRLMQVSRFYGIKQGQIQ